MRAFVTGAHGFVGNVLTPALANAGYEVVAPDASALDITDLQNTTEAIVDSEPQIIFHLAAVSSVDVSWQDPHLCAEVNMVGTSNVVQAAMALPKAKWPRVIPISSAEVYGHIKQHEVPVTELNELRPANPYAASKIATEYICLAAHHGSGLDVVIPRSFNHIGVGQQGPFIVSAFAERIKTAIAEGKTNIPVGNLEAKRDFTDVRDTVRAYIALAENGEPGQTYNVCSGHPIAIRHIVETMLSIADAGLKLCVDQALVRPNDLPIMCGDASKLHKATGWKPEIPIEQTLQDVLAYTLGR